MQPGFGDKKSSFHAEERAAWQWLLGYPDKPAREDVPVEFHDLLPTELAPGIECVVVRLLLLGAVCSAVAGCVRRALATSRCSRVLSALRSRAVARLRINKPEVIEAAQKAVESHSQP